jgi:hypothetical protein
LELTPKKLTPPRGGNWCYFGGPHPFSLSPFSNDWKVTLNAN